MSQKIIRVVLVGIVCCVVFVFVAFVWPTPYRYEKVSRSRGGGEYLERIYRINRFTGNVVLVLDSWTGPVKDPK